MLSIATTNPRWALSLAQDLGNMSIPNSRPNLDRRAIRNGAINLFDLFVGHGNAARRPVGETVKRAHPTASILQSVDHDVSTWHYAALLSR